MENIFTIREKHLCDLKQSYKLLLETYPQNQEISFSDNHENDSFLTACQSLFKLPTTVPNFTMMWDCGRERISYDEGKRCNNLRKRG